MGEVIDISKAKASKEEVFPGAEPNLFDHAVACGLGPVSRGFIRRFFKEVPITYIRPHDHLPQLTPRLGACGMRQRGMAYDGGVYVCYRPGRDVHSS